MAWNKKTDVFFLVVGHGTQTNGVWDCGCTYGSITEADLMFPIVKEAVRRLRKAGVRVMSDADTNNNKNIVKCVEWANEENAKKGQTVKYYMSIHCDTKTAPEGVAPLYVSKAGKDLAVKVGKKVAKAMGMKYRGVFYRTNLHELNATNMTAVIFETSCIKDPHLKESKKYGKALADAICDYIGVEPFKHTNAWRLRRTAKKVTAYMKKLNFKYKKEWRDNALSWNKAKEKRSTNCSTMVSYCLQKMGLLKPGEYFWINGDNIVCKGGLTEAKIKKFATILHPHKSPKDFKMKKGDICGYQNNAHTQIYEGKTKVKTVNGKKVGGNPKWYSTGGAGDIKEGKAHVKKNYNNKKISTIIRLK